MTETVKAPALEVRGLVKRYEETLAVDGVSLTVDGEIFGLLGANGAGKSTLIKSVLGLVAPTSGEVRVCGFDPRQQPLEAKSRIGYLPEELRLYDRLTGWEFLELVGGLKDADCGAGAEEDLKRFGLYERRNELIGEYSLGMRKKIGITAALLGEPKLLLLDEPLNGLDAESMRTLRLRLESMAERGATIVVSSHVMGFIERICGRVVILRQGRAVIEGSAAELRQAAKMADAAFDDVFLHFALARDPG